MKRSIYRILKSGLCASGFLSLAVAGAFADAVVSEDTSLTEDYPYAGVVTVNKDATLDLNGFDLGSPTTGNVVSNIAGTGTITNTGAETSLLTIQNTSNNDGLAPTITGNISVAFNSSNSGVIMRINNAANSWTGDTYLNIGRLHVTSGDCLGSGSLYLNGNLVNNNTGVANLTVNNPIVINGENASIRAAYGGSITIAGTISQADGVNAKFTIGALESGANSYVILGENAYSCGTWIGDASYSWITPKITLGTSTSLGSGPVQMISNADVTMNSKATKFTNAIHLGGKTLSFTTSEQFNFSSKVDNLTNAGAAATNAGTLSFKNTGNEKTFSVNGSISGDVDLKFGSSARTYYRIYLKNQDNVGDTYLTGGANSRLHVSYGSGLGSGSIYLDGNLCNNSDGAKVSFDQDLVVSGGSASLRVAYSNGNPMAAYMRLNGVISSDSAKDSSYALIFNENETAPGMIFLYGENTFSCPSSFSNQNQTNHVTLGTDSALGTSRLTVNGSGTLYLEANTEDTVRTMANDIFVKKGKTIRLATVATEWASDAENSAVSQTAAKGSGVISSTITGEENAKVVFGLDDNARNAGQITFSGTVGAEVSPVESSVAAGQKFASDHAAFYGDLTMNSSSALVVDGGLSVWGDMIAPKSIVLVVDNTEDDFELLNVGGQLTLADDASIFVDVDPSLDAADPLNTILVLGASEVVDEAGNALTMEEVFSRMTWDDSLFASDASWNYVWNLTSSGVYLQADPAAVPEPAAWTLLLLGMGVLAGRNCRRKNRQSKN